MKARHAEQALCACLDMTMEASGCAKRGQDKKEHLTALHHFGQDIRKVSSDTLAESLKAKGIKL
jgi:hypothetical protein